MIELEEIPRIQDQFEQAYPQEILKWAVETYGDRLAIVTSFQPTGIVTLHMLQEIAPKIPVITLDTGLLFQETYDLIDEVEQLFDLNLVRVKPELSVEDQAQLHGEKLWERNPDQCCQIRKTVPLQKALNGYDAWITGLRRDQSANRAAIPVIAPDRRTGLIKLSPFVNWTEEMIWTYIHAYELPYNELHDRGYPSIGCWTCTHAVSSGDDMRSGRWSNHAKTECGIHYELTGEFSHAHA